MAISSSSKARKLTDSEVSSLIKQGNSAVDWDKILVEDPFNPDKFQKNTFSGDVVIGACTKTALENGSLSLPSGIYNSVISNSIIGDNCSIHNVKLISDYIIGNNVILFNIDELSVSSHPLFGTGIVDSKGERNWLDIANENGGRRVLPFRSIMAADCFLWSKYREEPRFMKKLTALTDKFEQLSGKKKGTIGNDTIIRSSRIIQDVIIGEKAAITGADLLQNLTIQSSSDTPTIIGVGSKLFNGIIHSGAQVLYDVKAYNFVLSSHSTLKSGARFFDSFLGENSTISCCEVQSSLIFPFHEQHHNNSFLIASTIQGQSNIAAGATIGSNHNSRGADGEIVAERGFWPALSSSLKHNCKFAAFTLLAKADYPHELNIELPFSLVSQDESNNRLIIMPAYWFLYNMYALARNSWKFNIRDKRKDKSQYLEFDYLAPDTIEEIFKSLDLLTLWTGKAWYRKYRSFTDYVNTEKLMEKGEEILNGETGEIASLEILGEGLENSTRNVLIIKAEQAYKAYKEMIHYYAVKNITWYATVNSLSLSTVTDMFMGAARASWINLGGQLMKKNELEILKKDILTSEIDSWEEIHNRYLTLSKDYTENKCRHAFASLMSLYNINSSDIDRKFWEKTLEMALTIQKHIEKNTYDSRLKDYTNKYRRITFDTKEEMEAVIGTIEDDTFIHIIQKEAKLFKTSVEKLLY